MAPKWAKDLIIQIARDEGRKDTPVLKWRKTRKLKPWESYCYSSGYCCQNKIVVTAGTTGKKDEKLVLIHELTHWLMRVGEHHSEKFWDKAFKLYRKYGVPLKYALDREGSYRKRAIIAYRKNVDRFEADQAIAKATKSTEDSNMGRSQKPPREPGRGGESAYGK